MNAFDEGFDLAVSRVVDRIDGADDWQVLDGVAADRPECWRELVSALRTDAALRVALQPARQVVERRALPASRRHSLRPAAAWSGWLAALLVAAAWLATTANESRPPAPSPSVRAGAASASPPPDVPRAVEELDRVLVDARPAAGGAGFDVVYLRRVLERARVPALYQLAADEHGRPAATAVTAAELAPATDY